MVFAQRPIPLKPPTRVGSGRFRPAGPELSWRIPGGSASTQRPEAADPGLARQPGPTRTGSV